FRSQSELDKQVGGAGPHRIQPVRIDRSLGQELLHLHGYRRRGSGRRRGGKSRELRHAGAALGIVVASLVGGSRRRAVPLREHLGQIGPGFVVNLPVPGGSTGLKEPASLRLSPKKKNWP